MMEEEREPEVIRLTMLGCGNIEIGETLGISLKPIALCLKNG
jgi:DNA-binding CsgD family transcriptional regulator